MQSNFGLRVSNHYTVVGVLCHDMPMSIRGKHTPLQPYVRSAADPRPSARSKLTNRASLCRINLCMQWLKHEEAISLKLSKHKFSCLRADLHDLVSHVCPCLS